MKTIIIFLLFTAGVFAQDTAQSAIRGYINPNIKILGVYPYALTEKRVDSLYKELSSPYWALKIYNSSNIITVNYKGSSFTLMPYEAMEIPVTSEIQEIISKDFFIKGK